jgi:ribosomal subunit interface protein
MDFIVGESFELTEAIKNNVQERLNKVRSFLKTETETPISVFLDKLGPREFSVRLALHYRHHDFVAEDRGDDFYHVLGLAKEHMIRQLTDFKTMRKTKRKSKAG